MTTAKQLFLPVEGKGLDGALVHVYVKYARQGEKTKIKPFVSNITSADDNNTILSCWVPVRNLPELSGLPEVVSIRTVQPPVIHVGQVTTDGDTVHRTADLRSLAGLNGTGVRVGIISDGVDYLADAQSTGDLPPDVHVLRNAAGGNEGTEMLQIVHDMAPGAELYFHDYGDTHIQFNQAIDALVAVNCTVICDDVSWFDEPYFSDGIIASHVADLVAGGKAVYISSAGNYAESHYQGVFSDDGEGFHDFSGGVSDDRKYLYVTSPPEGSVRIDLQWDDPWGGSANDYDLFLFDTSDYSENIGESVDTQGGSGIPAEGITYTNYGSRTVYAEIDVVKNEGAAARTLEVFILPDGPALVQPYNLVPSDSVFGHPAVPGVIAVAAVSKSAPGAYVIEDFSSQGPVTIRYPEAQVREKPDISGLDRVTVIGQGGIPDTFYGTSASAPHIAGVAACVWSGYPDVAAGEIRESLFSSATDLGNAGVDHIFGYGLANATAMARVLEESLGPDEVIHLLHGWNFISAPAVLEEGNNTAVKVFRGIDTAGHSIWGYNASVRTFVQVTAGTEIIPHEGIWVYSTGNQTIDLYFNRSALPAPGKVLSPGWNSIGPPVTGPMTARDAFASVRTGWTTLIGFNATTQAYDRSVINGGSGIHSDGTIVSPARGYWLFMNRTAVLDG
ncbi:MAG: S8 family serine peptidase [Methanoregulaceae archaeon]|nr:S8 family serine peptidase [Methanoregulaceae archaeon]